MTSTEGPLLLVAASGLARETAASAAAAGFAVRGCLDDNPALWGTFVAPGLPVLGPVESVTEHPDTRLLVCAGRGSVREQLVDRLTRAKVEPGRYATLVDPAATVRDASLVGAGSILLAGVVLTSDVELAGHVVCMPNVVVTHDCRAEDFATLCAGVVLGGGVVLARSAYVGMGVSVRQGVVVGASATVGMGSVVLNDVPPGETWAGVPARALAPRALLPEAPACQPPALG